MRIIKIQNPIRKVFWVAVAWLLFSLAATGYAQTEGDHLAERSSSRIEAIEVLASAAASATAVIEGAITDNVIQESNVSRHTLLENSGLDNAGIVMLNQDTGVANNQSNVRVLALSTLDGGGQIHENQLTGMLTTTDNKVLTIGGERSNTITGSFGGTVGVVGINQASGVLNHETNLMVMTVGTGYSTDTGELPDVYSIDASALAQVKANNVVDPASEPGPHSDILVDNFEGFRGFAQVNQSTGNLNFLTNGISLSVSTIEVR